MILKGNQRGGGCELAAHLLRSDQNEHVEVHEVRGFMADDLHGAFQEVHALSKGTRAKQPFFSLSLNPPAKERVPIEVFESSIEVIEQRLGLTGQPRAIVFHEKDGRRHAHAVWSRIDATQMKAINLPHYKFKLRDVAREIYLEHGWQMPRGFVSSAESDPYTFTREQWQQSQRSGHDPKVVKRLFHECWAISDSGAAFAQALKSRGYTLARGDRRGFVALDYRGKPYSITKYTGQSIKDVKARLGEPNDTSPWPSFEKATNEIADRMSGALRRHVEEAERQARLRSAALHFQYTQTVQRQRAEREKLRFALEQRERAESAARAQRLSRGWRGLWDRVTGRHQRIQHQNEREALLAFYRDRQQKDDLIFRQLEERQGIVKRVRDEKKSHSLELQRLHADIAHARDIRIAPAHRPSERAERPGDTRKPKREPERSPDFEP